MAKIYLGNVRKLIPNKTQRERVLERLRDGGWIDGMEFLRTYPPITQFHARIWELQQLGYAIEGEFIEGKNWKQYRLIAEPQPKETERVQAAML